MISISQRLGEDLLIATRAGDHLRRDILRLLRSALRYEEINKGRPLEEQEELTVLYQQAKRQRESIEGFRRGNRTEQAEREEAQLGIVREYLPASLTREEVESLARQVIQEVGAKGPTDRGRVMGTLMPKVRGRFEGAEVGVLVGELLEVLSQE